MINRARGDIRRLAAASAISGTGDWAASIALALGIYQRRTPDAIRGRVFAAIGAVMTFATAVSFGFAGFLVEAVSWRPVCLGGGLVDVACAVTLALSLRWTPWRPAEPGPVSRTTGS